MSININVQPGDGDVWVNARKFDGATGFVTLEIGDLGKGSVSLFIRTVEDARKVLDAALEAFRLTSELETEKIVASAKREALTAAATAIEESRPVWDEASADEYDGYLEGPCQCSICIDAAT